MSRGGSSLGAAARILRLPPRDRRRAIEAVVELTLASLRIRLLPSRRTVSLLGQIASGGDGASAPQEQLREAVRVGRIVAAAAARLPWHPTCLPQAIAVQRMLKRREIPGRLHLGVTDARSLTAHAWVTVGERAVIGGRGLERHVPLAAFG